MQKPRQRQERIRPNNVVNLFKQESRAIARKPRDAAAVLFGLKFADIHHKFESSQAPKVSLIRALDIPAQNRI